jgi:NADH-quinone oxidoreductase subunit C
MSNMQILLEKIEVKFKFSIFSCEKNYLSIILENANDLPALMEELKLSYKFRTLMDICGVDYPNEEKRFEVVYQLLNMEDNTRLTLKVKISEGESVPSITRIHSGACWFERETFDMYGIEFSESHDLRRILTDYDFEGFPLRKDFPLTGYVELQYDATLEQIVKKPVNLSQEYRNFDFESPWENVQYQIKKS